MTEITAYVSSFQILPLGVFIYSDIETPPDEADFEQLFKQLAARRDSLRWQIAAACNLFHRYHRNYAYEKAAAWLELSPETVESWAYVERNVPYHNRRSSPLTISHHRLIAKLPYDEQAAYLGYCEKQQMTVATFERWLNTQMDVDTPPVIYRSDRLHELELENYNLATENAELKAKVGMAPLKAPDFTNESDEPGQLVKMIIAALDRLFAVYPAGVEQVRNYIENLKGY